MEVRRSGGVCVEMVELRCRLILEVKLNLRFKLGTSRAREGSRRQLEDNDRLKVKVKVKSVLSLRTSLYYITEHIF